MIENIGKMLLDIFRYIFELKSHETSWMAMCIKNRIRCDEDNDVSMYNNIIQVIYINFLFNFFFSISFSLLSYWQHFVQNCSSFLFVHFFLQSKYHHIYSHMLQLQYISTSQLFSREVNPQLPIIQNIDIDTFLQQQYRNRLGR